MQVKEAIEQRRSIRKFKEDPVDPSVLEELLEAARLAPSGSNIQPWRFQAVTSGDMRTKLAACTFRLNFIAEAPITMVCCADSKALETRKRRVNELVVSGAFQGTGLEDISLSDYPDSSRRSDAANQAYVNLNVAIAIEHMVLRGVELGLGSCWTMLFSQRKVKELLDLPDTFHVVALVPFGYADQQPKQRPRLAREEIYMGEV